MWIQAIWYYHSPEGQRFLEARELRIMLAAVGILGGYVLLRTHRRFSHQESRWWTVWRLIAALTIASALWLLVDLLRGENWIFQLFAILPELHDNGIRYLVLIIAGWFGWSIVLFEGLRWIAIVRRR